MAQALCLPIDSVHIICYTSIAVTVLRSRSVSLRTMAASLLARAGGDEPVTASIPDSAPPRSPHRHITSCSRGPAIQPHYTILVVEDDPAIRRLLEALLASAGYDVRLAIDGLDALDRFAESRPDMVFLDVTLPRLSGWEVLHDLRATPDAPPIVLLTADHAAVGRARAAGATEVILKPFDIDEVLHLAGRLLGQPSNHG